LLSLGHGLLSLEFGSDCLKSQAIVSQKNQAERAKKSIKKKIAPKSELAIVMPTHKE
jgi:hypothetical protein